MMIKFQLEAITPIGKFTSEIKEYNEKEMRHVKEYLQKLDLEYLTFNLEDGGNITLASETCKNSAFIIKTIES